MNILELTGVVFSGALLAGLIGSLTGLGGGIIITPLLTLVLGVDIHYAIGAALVSVIATSCGAASAYVKEGLSNIRLGMFMEVATTTGALIGASLALRVSTAAIAELFGAVLLYSAAASLWPRAKSAATDSADRCCDEPRVGFQLSNCEWNRRLPCPPHSRGDQRDARRWNVIRSPRDRIGRIQSNRLRQDYEGPVQSLNDHEQFHDRGDCRGKRRFVPAARLHRSWPRNARCTGRTLWIVLRGSCAARHENQCTETCICNRDRGARDRNDFSRTEGSNLTCDILKPP